MLIQHIYISMCISTTIHVVHAKCYKNLTKWVHEKYCLHQEIGERKEVEGGIDREREGERYQKGRITS